MVVEQYGVAERILDVHSQGILWVQDVVDPAGNSAGPFGRMDHLRALLIAWADALSPERLQAPPVCPLSPLPSTRNADHCLLALVPRVCVSQQHRPCTVYPTCISALQAA